MVDIDTFLTILYVVVDDFDKTCLPPERRLRNTELRCGPGETPLFRHGEEGKKVVDVLARHS
jgi:hypothetical protein